MLTYLDSAAFSCTRLWRKAHYLSEPHDPSVVLLNQRVWADAAPAFLTSFGFARPRNRVDINGVVCYEFFRIAAAWIMQTRIDIAALCGRVAFLRRVGNYFLGLAHFARVILFQSHLSASALLLNYKLFLVGFADFACRASGLADLPWKKNVFG